MPVNFLGWKMITNTFVAHIDVTETESIQFFPLWHIYQIKTISKKCLKFYFFHYLSHMDRHFVWQYKQWTNATIWIILGMKNDIILFCHI